MVLRYPKIQKFSILLKVKNGFFKSAHGQKNMLLIKKLIIRNFCKNFFKVSKNLRSKARLVEYFFSIILVKSVSAYSSTIYSKSKSTGVLTVNLFFVSSHLDSTLKIRFALKYYSNSKDNLFIFNFKTF